jgi:hypothetical protein
MDPRGWENLNANRKYPFSDTAVLEDINDLICLPNTFILDVQLTVQYPAYLPIKLAAVYKTKQIVSVVFTDATNTSVAYGTFTSSGINKLYAGSITIGDFPDIIGKYTFENAFLLDSTINIIKKGGVLSLQGLKGDVKLEAGAGVSLEYDYKQNAIMIGLTNPNQFIPDCYRETPCNENLCNRQPVYTINGVSPDSNGNFTIQSAGIIEITNENCLITLNSDDITPTDLCDIYIQAPSGPPGDVGPRGTPGAGGILLCADCPSEPCPGVFKGDCCQDCSSPSNPDLCKEIL